MIKLNRPYVGEEELCAVKKVIDSGNLSQGEITEEFEIRVKKYTGVKYAIAVSSCTAGLHLVIRSILDRIGDGRVAVTALTFPAVQSIMNWERGQITNIDVERNTYNIDPKDLKKKIEEMYVDLIVGTDLFGLSCNRDELEKMARKENTPIIYDAACALGSEYKGEKIGKKGTNIFSLHGRKITTTGEGGIICTDDEEIYESVLHGRNYGKDRKGKFSGGGLNFKLSNIAAAIGIEQMKKIDRIIKFRRYVARMYDKLLVEQVIDNYDWFNYYHLPYVMNMTAREDTNWQSYVIQIRERKGVPTRDQVMGRMRRNGIECQIGSYDNSGGTCPISAELARTTLALPIWPGMDKLDIERVVNTLTCVIK